MPRTRSDDDVDDGRVGRLLETCDRLLETLATMTGADRIRLEKDVREIRNKLNELDRVGQRFEKVEKFVEGEGTGVHVGQRLERLDTINEQRDKDLERVDGTIEKMETRYHRLMWGILGASVAALGACFAELLQFLVSKK